MNIYQFLGPIEGPREPLEQLSQIETFLMLTNSTLRYVLI